MIGAPGPLFFASHSRPLITIHTLFMEFFFEHSSKMLFEGNVDNFVEFSSFLSNFNKMLQKAKIDKGKIALQRGTFF